MRKYLHIGLFITICLTLLSLSINASESKFVLSDLENDRGIAFAEKIELKKINEEISLDSIDCFAVSGNGFVAIGSYSASMSDNKICVFTSDGVFQYAYSFVSGESFYMYWSEDNIVICFVRSEKAMTVDENGKCARYSQIDDNEENKLRWNEIGKNKIEISGNTYMMEKTDSGVICRLRTRV